MGECVRWTYRTPCCIYVQREIQEDISLLFRRKCRSKSVSVPCPCLVPSARPLTTSLQVHAVLALTHHSSLHQDSTRTTEQHIAQYTQIDSLPEARPSWLGGARARSSALDTESRIIADALRRPSARPTLDTTADMVSSSLYRSADRLLGVAAAAAAGGWPVLTSWACPMVLTQTHARLPSAQKGACIR